MDHLAWIKKQFDRTRTTACYRNVLIHTSFVETIVKAEALLELSKQRQKTKKKRSAKRKKTRNEIGFADAIGVLRGKGHAMYEIDQLRAMRNVIIHELLKNEKLGEPLIRTTIEEMRVLLKHIYDSSSLVQGYFLKEHQIDTGRF